VANRAARVGARAIAPTTYVEGETIAPSRAAQ
jgi:hypothetical protein